jgi:NADH dehydrogenase/NADH:ubiquinone oxidoreductase subunit G
MADTNGKAAAVKFTLDGKEVEALPGETIWQVAKRQGIEIPHLCYSPEPGYRADGNCRACMVEIEASACWPPAASASHPKA